MLDLGFLHWRVLLHVSLIEAPPGDQPSIRSNHSFSDTPCENKQRNVEPTDNKTWKLQITKPKNHWQRNADTCTIKHRYQYRLIGVLLLGNGKPWKRTHRKKNLDNKPQRPDTTEQVVGHMDNKLEKSTPRSCTTMTGNSKTKLYWPCIVYIGGYRSLLLPRYVC